MNRAILVQSIVGALSLFAAAPCHAVGDSTQERQKKVKTDGFRGCSWGASRAVVKKNEKAKLLGEGDGIVAYVSKLAGLKVSVGYTFVDDRLALGDYVVDEKHTNMNNFISDYNKLQKLITKKYGNPTTAGANWSNSLFKNNKEQWGTAVSVGHLAMVSEWELLDAKVQLMLSGDNLKISLHLRYESREYGHLVAERQEKETLQEL